MLPPSATTPSTTGATPTPAPRKPALGKAGKSIVASGGVGGRPHKNKVTFAEGTDDGTNRRNRDFVKVARAHAVRYNVEIEVGTLAEDDVLASEDPVVEPLDLIPCPYIEECVRSHVHTPTVEMASIADNGLIIMETAAWAGSGDTEDNRNYLPDALVDNNAFLPQTPSPLTPLSPQVPQTALDNQAFLPEAAKSPEAAGCDENPVVDNLVFLRGKAEQNEEVMLLPDNPALEGAEENQEENCNFLQPEDVDDVDNQNNWCHKKDDLCGSQRKSVSGKGSEGAVASFDEGAGDSTSLLSSVRGRQQSVDSGSLPDGPCAAALSPVNAEGGPVHVEISKELSLEVGVPMLRPSACERTRLASSLEERWRQGGGSGCSPLWLGRSRAAAFSASLQSVPESTGVIKSLARAASASPLPRCPAALCMNNSFIGESFEATSIASLSEQLAAWGCEVGLASPDVDEILRVEADHWAAVTLLPGTAGTEVERQSAEVGRNFNAPVVTILPGLTANDTTLKSLDIVGLASKAPVADSNIGDLHEVAISVNLQAGDDFTTGKVGDETEQTSTEPVVNVMMGGNGTGDKSPQDPCNSEETSEKDLEEVAVDGKDFIPTLKDCDTPEPSSKLLPVEARKCVSEGDPPSLGVDSAPDGKYQVVEEEEEMAMEASEGLIGTVAAGQPALRVVTGAGAGPLQGDLGVVLESAVEEVRGRRKSKEAEAVRPRDELGVVRSVLRSMRRRVTRRNSTRFANRHAPPDGDLT